MTDLRAFSLEAALAECIDDDGPTVAAIRHFAVEPCLDGDVVAWRAAPTQSGDLDVVRPVSDPVSKTGGLVLLKGNIGRAIIKVSAVKPALRIIEVPAIIFKSQQDLIDRFKAGELNRDFVAVVPFQGPKANGMPELHRLTPPLGVLQDKGFKVELVTDGRMSGASGKVPAAIHLSPEALDGGVIAKIRDGDMIRLDSDVGVLEVLVSADDLSAREALSSVLATEHYGSGRELFAGMRSFVTSAERGAMTFDLRENDARDE